jgi:hypothetical protein
MADQPRLIVQLPRGGAVDRQLATDAPQSVASGRVVINRGPTDSRGYLEPPGAGEVVLSVPSPEALARDADEVRRVIEGAGTGVEPLVVVVEAADELRDDELASIVEATGRTSRSVILRIMGDG